MSTREATGEVTLIAQATIVNLLDDGQQPSASLGGTLYSEKFESGTDESEYNREWEDQRSLLSGVSEDIDFFDFGSLDIGAGAGKDALGQALALDEIVVLLIYQISGAGKLEINATNPTGKLTWVPTVSVANKGATGTTHLLMCCTSEHGYPVVDGTSHVIRFKANGGDVVYRIVVFGRDLEEESTSATASSASSFSTRSSSSLSTSSLSASSLSSSSSTGTVSSLSSLSSSSTSTLSSSSSSTSSLSVSSSSSE